MSVYTPLNEDQIRSWLERYLTSPLLSFEGIQGGTVNTNYLIKTSKQRYILTLFEAFPKNEAQKRLEMMNHLHAKGFACPKAMLDTDGQALSFLANKPAALISFLEGKTLSNVQAQHCYTLGSTLATMHKFLEDLPLNIDNHMGWSWREQTMSQVAPFLNSTEKTLLHSEYNIYKATNWKSLPQSLIHADCFVDNVMFDGNRLVGIFDFNCACHEAKLFDIAVSLNDWCFKQGQLNIDCANALINGYRSVQSFSLSEQELWPRMVRLCAWNIWLGRLFAQHCGRRADKITIKDPKEYQHILEYLIDGFELSIAKD